MLQVGKPVTGKNLIGRESELKLIKEYLYAGQVVSLIGPKGMGKTSIILEIFRQLKEEGFFTSYIDVFSTPDTHSLSGKIIESVLSNRKFGNSFRKALINVEEFVSNIPFKKEIEDFSFIQEYNNNITHPKSEIFENSIDFIDNYSVKANKKISFAFDEFGDIQKYNKPEITKKIRSKIQQHKNAVYIFSGSYESSMNELFLKRKSPFYRIAKVINLGNICKTTYSLYIKELFIQEKIIIPNNRIEQILEFSDGHPYCTRLYVQELIVFSKLNPGKKLPNHDQIIDHLLMIEKSYLEKSWEEVTKRKELRIIVTTIAKNPDRIYTRINHREINIPRGLKTLVGKGIIKQENNKYYLTDPLQKEWINRFINK